jgi:hypothetical protein
VKQLETMDMFHQLQKELLTQNQLIPDKDMIVLFYRFFVILAASMRLGLGITGSSYLQNSADEGFARDVKI